MSLSDFHVRDLRTDKTCVIPKGEVYGPKGMSLGRALAKAVGEPVRKCSAERAVYVVHFRVVVAAVAYFEPAEEFQGPYWYKREEE